MQIVFNNILEMSPILTWQLFVLQILLFIAIRILFYKYLQYFRFGKMLALSHQHGLAQHTITMVAALSMQEVLLETPIGNI